MNVFCPCFQIYACMLLNLKGMSIAFAIAESLLDTGSMTLLVTHYPQITHLANLYPAVKNMHLKTSIDLSLSESGDEMPPRNHTAAATRAGWQYKCILTAGLCVVCMYVCMHVCMYTMILHRIFLVYNQCTYSSLNRYVNLCY
jgi:hypothetical protein